MAVISVQLRRAASARWVAVSADRGAEAPQTMSINPATGTTWLACNNAAITARCRPRRPTDTYLQRPQHRTVHGAVSHVRARVRILYVTNRMLRDMRTTTASMTEFACGRSVADLRLERTAADRHVIGIVAEHE